LIAPSRRDEFSHAPARVAFAMIASAKLARGRKKFDRIGAFAGHDANHDYATGTARSPAGTGDGLQLEVAGRHRNSSQPGPTNDMTTKTAPQKKSAEFSNLRDLFIEQLKDLYSAEKQIVKDGLPKMIKTASNEDLIEGLTGHLEETKGQVDRLDQISELLGEKLTGVTCEATKGLLKEASGWMEEDATDEVMDAGIIADGQRIEHYEISAYGTAHAYAELLGEDKCAELLAETLAEEKAANEKLGKAAKKINQSALAVA
jgi:ferritin-like metal-binding protein YciE